MSDAKSPEESINAHHIDPKRADPAHFDNVDVFGDEEHHRIRYKTLSWQMVAFLMITEVVSNGMLSLPSSLAAVGIVPGVVLILFLGVFATYTSYLLVQFKLNHPQVHNLGDAGYILFGRFGRELLSFGTLAFAIFSTGSQLLSGRLALAALSNNKFCTVLYSVIFFTPIFLVSFPRTLDRLSWLRIPGAFSIVLSGIVAMIGAGLNPVPNRSISATVPSDIFRAFVAITNPVFSYAGHFMFFILISEMRRPQDAMKAVYVLQGFATSFYLLFAVLIYMYIGSTVASPALSSLPEKWEKAAYAIAIPNFWISGSLFAHTAAKLLFVRFFRNSRHLYEHTVLGWTVWIALVAASNSLSLVLALAVPIFSYLVGVAASLFASWYTYGIAGAFWLHDSYYLTGKGFAAWREQWILAALNIAVFIAGAFICVAGTYVSVKLISDAYRSGLVGNPMSC